MRNEFLSYKKLRTSIKEFILNQGEKEEEAVFHNYKYYKSFAYKSKIVPEEKLLYLYNTLKSNNENKVNILFNIFLDIQNFYFNLSLDKIEGLGKKRIEVLNQNYNIYSIKDLILYFPKYYFFADKITPIRHLKVDVISVVSGEIVSVKFIKKLGAKPSRLEVSITDDTACMKIVWFNVNTGMYSSVKNKKYLLAAGKVKVFNGKQIIPFYYKFDDNPVIDTFSVTKYHIDKLPDKTFTKIISQIIDYLDCFYIEIIPDYLLKKRNLHDFVQSIRFGHLPQNNSHRLLCRRRLIYEEFLYFQISLQQKKFLQDSVLKKFSYQNNFDDVIDEFINNLEYKLTDDQLKAIDDIKNDMFSPKKMHRLLQGDVGSGKTIVSAVAVLIALLNNKQVAIMAPTSILANQHFINFKKLFNNYKNIVVEFLSGNVKNKARKQIYSDLTEGKINLIIGTHALFQDTVNFENINLVVIDEQHRFGVKQREKIITKGVDVDVLFLSATPIPRTLAISYYGDMDTSLIIQKPAGRIPVRTFVRKEEHKPKIFSFIKDKVSNENFQVFIICPLIYESEKLNLMSAETYYEELSSVHFKDFNVALLHGKTDEKDALIQKFKNKEIDILVSTTVIEVGLDVPDANIIIIENAEHFGLSQLHQLRGRVGRDNKESYCVFLTKDKITDSAAKRLKTLEKYNDGFKISEIDLLLRGTGEILGLKQSGFVDFKFGNIVKNSKELLEAYNDAQLVFKNKTGYKENKLIEIALNKYAKKIDKINY